MNTNKTSLTDDENTKLHKTGMCPSCEVPLKQGPCGGLSMNVRCPNCEAIIWLVPGMPAFGSKWITRP